MTDHGYANCDEYKICVDYKEESRDDFEHEVNDEISVANNIRINHDYTGNLSEKDIDYFTFSLASKGTVLPMLKVSDKADNVFKINFLDEKGKLLDVEMVSTLDTTCVGEEMDLDIGKYFVKIENGINSDSSIEYTLKIISTATDGCIEATTTPLELSTAMPKESEQPSVVLTKEPEQPSISHDATTIPTVEPHEKGNTGTIKSLSVYCDIGEDEEVYVGDKVILYVKARPDEFNKELKLMWYSENPKIADVNQEGEVTCIGEGSTTIFVKTTDGSEIIGSYEIVVNENQEDRFEDEINTLSKLIYSQGKLSPKFNKNKTWYTLTLDSDVSSTIIKYKKTSSYSNVTINGKQVSKIKVKLRKGKSKTIEIEVTADNGDLNVYTIMVTRKSSRKTKSSSGKISKERSKKQLFNAILKNCKRELQLDDSEGFKFMSYEKSVKSGLSVSYQGDEYGMQHYVVDVPGFYYLYDYKKRVYAEFDVYYSYWSGSPSYKAEISFYYEK